MRTKNSIINITVSCFSYVIIMIGSFVTRQLFTSTLGLEIVGIEGPFLNIVSALAIVELGLGVGIVYKLYKPISESDWNKVSTILCFLRNAYILIASAMLFMGIGISFFIGIIPIEGTFSKMWLSFIFLLYVLDIIASYLFSHKRAMFIADQKNYINNIIRTITQVILFILQISVLVVFKSFEGYLICKIVTRLAENLCINYYFNKKYPFINLKSKEKLPKVERTELFANIKAMLMHKIAEFSLKSTSSFIVMYFISLRESGVYSNYMLIVNALISISNEFFNGVIASFGNLLSTNSKEKVYSNFKILYFINFIIYSFFTVSFFNIVTPFMKIWIPVENSTFPLLTIAALSGYLYIFGIRQSLLMVKIGAGIYNPDKYFAILEAVITFVLSIGLSQVLGVAGVMMANIASMLIVPFWTQPYLVYKTVFNRNAREYYYKYVIYAGLTVIYTYIVYVICSHIQAHGIMGVLINGIICLIIPNLINVILFYKTNEFKQIISYGKLIINRKNR